MFAHSSRYPCSAATQFLLQDLCTAVLARRRPRWPFWTGLEEILSLPGYSGSLPFRFACDTLEPYSIPCLTYRARSSLSTFSMRPWLVPYVRPYRAGLKENDVQLLLSSSPPAVRCHSAISVNRRPYLRLLCSRPTVARTSSVRA